MEVVTLITFTISLQPDPNSFRRRSKMNPDRARPVVLAILFTVRGAHDR